MLLISWLYYAEILQGAIIDDFQVVLLRAIEHIL